jgi:alkanesulfonate monooxygenase SsuD/methylene tetrahydromethanopterin reductase-like flavin-dependent oxidoreductase (luciferase family)
MTFSIGFLIFPTPRSTNPVAAMDATNRILLQASQDHELMAWFVDHFQFNRQPYLECWTQMSFSAGRYPGLKTGTLVLGQGYRNPALVAKAAASFQHLNGGLTLGIGAGWKEDEYLAYGYSFPPAGQRLDELEEAVQIINGLWTEDTFTFAGKYHSVKNAICEPRPVIKPTLMIGGGGEKRTLRIAAKYADAWNVDYIHPEDFERKLGILHGYCDEIGRDPATIEPSYFALVSLNRDPDKVLKVMPPNYPPTAYMLNGGPDEVLEKLARFRDLGARHVQLSFLDYPGTDGIETFLEYVLPQIKEWN